MVAAVRRAFREFLALPTLVIAAFVVLAACTYTLDREQVAWIAPLRRLLEKRVFADSQATADLLSTVAGGIITVTSITISLLLLALQQAASALTSEVYDQFLRRRYNQFYFGFFVGLALYGLITLATVNADFNPVIAASVAFLLTVFALYLLIVLLYTTINQMRPVEVIAEIQRHTLAARHRQLRLISRTRTSARSAPGHRVPVRAEASGYVTDVHVNTLDEAARGSDDVEFILKVSIGAYVSFHDVIAEIGGARPERLDRLADRVRDAVRIERQQDLTTDPSHGIEQLENIAWTSVSSAKSDPAPGLLVIHSLRDVLARWAEPAGVEPGEAAPVVYTDGIPERLMRAFESIAVVSTESMQHQIFAEVLRTFAMLLHRLPTDQQERAERLIQRMLSGLGDHILSAQLDDALAQLSAALSGMGRTETADAVQQARESLSRSLGRIHSRATRSP